jgi:hypothetical protein
MTQDEFVLNTLFGIVEDKAFQKSEEAFHQEDVEGYSPKFREIQNLILTAYMGLLIYLRKEEGKAYEELDSYFVFSELKKCIGCLGVSFEAIKKAISIVPLGVSEGISQMEISKTFRIGGNHLDLPQFSLNLQEIRELDTCCKAVFGEEQDALGYQTQFQAPISASNSVIKL